MSCAPPHMQDDLIDADDYTEPIDNYSVLLDYGIKINREINQLIVLSSNPSTLES